MVVAAKSDKVVIGGFTVVLGKTESSSVLNKSGSVNMGLISPDMAMELMKPFGISEISVGHVLPIISTNTHFVCVEACSNNIFRLWGLRKK